MNTLAKWRLKRVIFSINNFHVNFNTMLYLLLNLRYKDANLEEHMARKGEVGKRIKLAREEMAISASELARKVEVTPTAVWNWETNGIVPRHDTFEKVARVLGKSADYLRHGAIVPASQEISSQLPGPSVAEVVEQARRKIAALTGFDLDRVELHLRFGPSDQRRL